MALDTYGDLIANKKDKKILKKIDKNYIIIFIATIIIFLPYFSNKFVKGHDYLTHIANIYSMDEFVSLKDFKLFPSKIRPVIANNLGYGNGIFYPQLAYNMTLLIYLIVKQLGFSLIVAIKIFEFLVVFLSGIFMYKFVLKAFGKKDIGLLSSIIYISMPYFITDIFLRMAYAEILIFLFIPIIMISIINLLNKEYKSFFIYFVIGYCGIINSHLVLSVYFTILILIVLLINIKEILNKKAILSLLLASILILGITSPFLIPMIEHKIGVEYVVFQDSSMVTIEKLNESQLSLYKFINNDKVFNVSINVVVFIIAFITIINSKKFVEDKKKRKFLYSLCVFTLISFILSSKFVNWKLIPKILWNIQFPWRVCVFIAFGMSVIAGLGINILKENRRKIVIAIVCVICLYSAICIIHKNDIKAWNIPSYEEISNINNSSVGEQKEYLTVNGKTNLKYLSNRNQDITVIEGETKINIIKNNVPNMEFEIQLETNQAKLEIPRLFYLGYEIILEKSDNTREKINYYENDKGLIEFEINKSGKIIINYSGTVLNRIANIVSIMMIMVFVIFILKKNKETKKCSDNY